MGALLLALLTAAPVATSTGNSAQAVIRGLQDHAVRWNGFSDIEIRENVCIGQTQGAAYELMVQGRGQANHFYLQDFAGRDSIPVRVEWKTGTGSGRGADLRPNQPMQLHGSTARVSSSEFSCTTNNAALILRINANDLHRVQAGSHSGTFSVTVIPR